MAQQRTKLADGLPEQAEGEDDRTYRARTEQMLVIPETDEDDVATGLYRVHSSSGREYTVDIDTASAACDCPDMTHNSPTGGCKHIRRVMLESDADDRPLPAPGEDAGDYWEWVAETQDRLKQERAALQSNLEVVEDLLAVTAAYADAE